MRLPGDHIPAYGLNNNIDDHFSGTSAAAPFVSGVAALVLSRYPKLDADGVFAQLINSAAPLRDTPQFVLNQPALLSLAGTIMEGVSPGRLDAYAALGSIVLTRAGTTPLSHITLSTNWGSGGLIIKQFTLGPQISFSADPTTTPSCTAIRLPPAPLPCTDSLSLASTNIAPGAYQITVHNDDAGTNITVNIKLAYPGLRFNPVNPVVSGIGGLITKSGGPLSPVTCCEAQASMFGNFRTAVFNVIKDP